MRIVGQALLVALVAYLSVVAPLRGKRRYERLRARIAADPGARLRLYQRAPVRGSVLCATVLIIGWLLDRSTGDVDLRWPRGGWGLGMVAGFLVAFAAGTVLGVRQVRSPHGRAFVEAQLGGARLLLPTTERERRWSVAIALSAGVWEELAYRGLLAEVVRTVFPTWPWLPVALVTGAVFGLAHLYQGPRGVVLTGLLGVALGSIVASTGSLLPAMVVHALIDLRSLTIIGWELRRYEPTPARAASTTGSPAAAGPVGGG